ncbi:hypothetical protein OK016_04630 [Vibrio chagasii]|nr:hypothetical protein [Vibrio chagasii]
MTKTINGCAKQSKWQSFFWLLVTEKSHETKEKVIRNFGMPKAKGYWRFNLLKPLNLNMLCSLSSIRLVHMPGADLALKNINTI